ncbi:acetyl-coenzyme A synthetase [Sphaeroforma arctica JP610]|uniref:Acetyl-coenzyme A synthetase n=1 Tax=Sphaeroforma arctica JP610 TaxID=667725 RepID=A0A0L0G510_9EUKA|nr:acetyl-coenzyme A synthetase [Sphaeroforma arctica JP610]KNC84009.1 acetyl-coenzyme A synthetase [Sphaeroforma arctica JP610]|eukprot:XP_014157911.1 acetyl-coenzyme A synthetase [Sphaeroforma arctica JP610]
MATRPNKSLTYPVPAAMAKAHCNSVEQYDEMMKESLENPGKFWGGIASEFKWNKKWDTDLSYNFHRSKGKVEIKWFEGGETNVCYNAIDRHIEAGKGDKIAFYWEGNEPTADGSMTYQQLHDRVCQMSNVLKSCGVTKGKVVALYMPMILELPIAMLACARVGALHTVIFGGFSSKSLSDRMFDAKADLLITASGVYRGKKFIDLLAISKEGVEMTAELGHEVPNVCVVQWTDVKADMPEQDSYWLLEDKIASASTECEVEWVDAEHPLFLLYTSGSTGTPKGVVHTTGGYMVYAYTTFKYVFDYQENDVFWCTADCGWITGHSYITYGPLFAGSTSIVFEGIPTYPDVGRFWEVCEKYKVTQFYTAPTAIRALKRYGDEAVLKYDLSSLRVLGSVGEPINPEAWEWYYRVVGQEKCAIVDTYWQTETGGHVLTPLPGVKPTKPGSCSGPFFGVDMNILDNEGKAVEGPGEGFLAISRPWPGMMRTVFNNHERFEATYFSQFDGFYCTGDGGIRDEDGYMWITGRVDDVMCISGHRIGTAEVEAAMGKHEGIAESAAIQIPHDIKGNSIYTFVVLRPGYEMTKELKKELVQIVRAEVGAFAAPDKIKEAEGLPKTRSGKIMRRILRKIATKDFDTLGDTSTLADSSVVDQLIKNANIED